MYKATATIIDNTINKKSYDVIIYSQYKTIQEALTGIKNFINHNYIIEKIIIEKA